MLASDTNMTPSTHAPKFVRQRWYITVGRILVIGLFCIGGSIALRGPTSNLLVALGRTAMERHDYTSAEKYFDLGSKVDPGNWAAYYERASVYIQTNRLLSAADDYSQSITLNPHNGQSYLGRGWVEDKMGKPDLALKDYNLGLSYDPLDAEGYDYRGYNYYHRGELKLALDDYNQALNLGLESSVVYAHRSRAYSDLGNIPGAISDISRAIELDPNNPDLFFTRSLYYLSSDPPDRAHALADLNHTLELDQGYVGAYYQRALVYDMLGQSASALNDYQYFVKHYSMQDKFYSYAVKRIQDLEQ